MASREEIIERIRIMQAWADGKEIQLKDGNLEWEDYLSDNPSFLFDRFGFRIKPKPREIYAVICSVQNNLKALKEVSANCTSGTLWREVLDDE